MKLENEYDYPLELFVQDSSDGRRATLRSNSGPASIYFWFTAEQARAAAQAFLDVAVELESNTGSLKSSEELVKELKLVKAAKPEGPPNVVFKASGLGRSTIGNDPSQNL